MFYSNSGYYFSQLKGVLELHAKLEKLLSTKQSLDRVLKGLPNKKSTKARRLKENKIKAEKRKRERLNRIQEEIKSKIIKLDSEGTDQCITKQMLQLNELEKLRADRHKAGLAGLINKGNWQSDARKCVLVKLTEWEMEANCFEDEEGGDNVVDDNSEEEEYQEIEVVEDDNEESKERDE